MSDLPRHSESHDATAAPGRDKPARPWLPYAIVGVAVAVLVLVAVLHLSGAISLSGGH